MSKPSLLDHIYSNITRKTLLSKPCLFDISDHLPICLIIKNLNSSKKSEIKLKRCMTSLATEDFLIDLGSTLENYPEINPNNSVNDDVSELTSIFMKTLDKHAPLKPMSRREIKLNAKPWITKEILISIKTTNKLFKSCYQCQNPVKIEHYKKHRNKLTHIKALAKQQRYDSLLRKNSNNPKKSWSVIREIIDNKSTSNINLPPTLRVNSKAYETHSNEFLDHNYVQIFCKHWLYIS